MFNSIEKWSIRRKLFIIYILPTIVWLIIGIALLFLPFEFSAVIFAIPGLWGAIAIVYPDPLVEFYFKVSKPTDEHIAKELSKALHTELRHV